MMKLSLVLLVVLVVSSVLLVQTDGKKVEKKKETIEEKGKTGGSVNKIAKKDKKGPGKLKEEKKKLADKGTKIKETKQEDIEQTKIEITEEKLKGKSLKTGRSVEKKLVDKVKRSVENRPQRTPDCKVGVRTGSEVSPAESAEPCGQLTSQKSSDSRSKPAPPCEVVAAELRLAEARRVAKEKLRKDKLKRRCELLEMEEQSNAEFADESTESEISNEEQVVHSPPKDQNLAEGEQTVGGQKKDNSAGENEIS